MRAFNSRTFADIFDHFSTVAAVYDRRFYGMLQGKTGGHRLPLQSESPRGMAVSGDSRKLPAADVMTTHCLPSFPR